MNPKRNLVGPGLFRQTIQLATGGPTSGQSVWFNPGDFPLSSFSLQVSLLDSSGNFIPSPTGSPTWNVQLLGSLDGQSPTQIIQHSNVGGVTNTNGETVQVIEAPWDYLMISWASLVWGNAATIQIIALGTPNVNLKG